MARRGRKPQGPYAERTVSFTMRMSKELRTALERETELEARQRKKPYALSQEVERRLRESLEMPQKLESQWGPKHIASFCLLISRVMRSVEASVGATADDKLLRWNRSAFTHAAVRAALDVLVAEYRPEGEIVPPERVKLGMEPIRAVKPELADGWGTPEGIGVGAAKGELAQMRGIDWRPLDHPASEHYSNGYFDLPRIKRDLATDD